MTGGGTIDLDWLSLTPDLGGRLVELLNSALSNTTRPSFIGPISVSSFDFGTAAPDVELVDVRDIYPDFLEDFGEEEEGLSTDRSAAERERLLEDFEWVSRREGAQSDMADDELFDSRYLPPHIRNSGVGQAWAGLPEARRPLGGDDVPDGSILSNIRPPSASGAAHSQSGDPRRATGEQRFPTVLPASPSRSPSGSPSEHPPQPPRREHPDVQLHFRIGFESNLRLMINTSLQINYPSPMIMALPIKLCVIGLVLEGELVVAYEGSRKRVHICFLDELATHGGPASCERARHNEELPAAEEPRTPARLPTSTGSSRLTGTPSKPSPAGTRLLPSILLETEIGQEDKHVLRNVARVERFVQDAIRKTIEEELVYPNFQTIVLADNEYT